MNLLKGARGRVFGILRKENIPLLTLSVIVLLVFYTNAWHEKYPDEFDNVMGGWFMLKGSLIYRDWFTHHGPMPYFLASVIEIFSGQSFVRFRIIYELFLGCFSLFGYWYVSKSIGKKYTSFYPFLLVFLGLIATYYWFHMLLADNISAFCILPSYLLVLLKSFHKKALTIRDLWLVSILLALAFYSSLAYTYFIAIFVIFTLLEYYRYTPLRIKKIGSYYPLIIFIIPHVVYGLYLLITGSLNDYIFDGIRFNTQYYIYNYPRAAGDTHINPLRYAIVIAHLFYTEFFTLLLGAFKFEFSFPMNLTLAVGSTGTVIFLFLKRKIRIALLVLLLIVYSNARSDPLKSAETDYQSAVYIILSLANIFFVLPALYRAASNIVTPLAKKYLYGVLLVLISIYSVYAFLFIVRKYEDKMFLKYMGQAPLIYDRPEIAPILNTILTSNDYVYVGPFEFEELFYTNAKLATKYQILIPGMGHSPEVQEEIIKELSANKPKIIVFDKNFFILGNRSGTYGQFLLDYLADNYVTVLDYKKGTVGYASVFGRSTSSRLDIDANFYLRRDIADKLLQKMAENNFVHETKR